MPDISRRGSEESLDFQPSEHAIELLKQFISSSPTVFSTRTSLTSGPLSLPTGPYAAPITLPAPSLASCALHPSPSSLISVPSTTSLTLLDRLHSLSSLLSRSLASPPLPPPHPPLLSLEDVSRTLLAAEAEHVKRPIPSFPIFQEQVRGVRLVAALCAAHDASVRRVGGDATTVAGRLYRLSHPPAPSLSPSPPDTDLTHQLQAEATLEASELDPAIAALQAAVDEAQAGGLHPRQWAMEEAVSALTHFHARKAYALAVAAATVGPAPPQAFTRDRLLTTCAHLNAHTLVQHGRLAVLEGLAGSWGLAGTASGGVSLASSPSLAGRTCAPRSPQTSPLLSPLSVPHSSHLLRPLAPQSPAFSPVIITADASLSTPTSSPSAFSLDGVHTRSPSQSISSDTRWLNVKTRSASNSLSAPAPPTHAPASPTPVRMGGFLKKKSPSSFLVSSWQRRYFRLSSQALTYHVDSSAASAALGVVPLSSIREVVEREGGSGGRFDVRVEGDRTFELEAVTAEERHVWAAKLREQTDAWHEKAKFSSVDSAATPAPHKASTPARQAAKWWKGAAPVKPSPSPTPTPAPKKEEGRGGAQVKAVLALAQRIARGDFEVVREEWGMTGGVGRLLIVRDRLTPLPPHLLPRTPGATPPSASPPTLGTRSPGGSVSQLQPLPPFAVVRLHDGLYMLHLHSEGEESGGGERGLGGLAHPSISRPLVSGGLRDHRFTLYAPYTPPASSLAAHLSRLHRFPPALVAHFAYHLTLALGYFHSQGRGCGRLALDCIHLTAAGLPLLSHPGLTLTLADRLASPATDDEPEGRLEYLSPEQLRIVARLKAEAVPGRARGGQ